TSPTTFFLNRYADLHDLHSFPTRRSSDLYKQLHHEVCLFANVLKRNGIKKGDRVIIYLPMIPEAAIAMLACSRIGAIHSVVFGRSEEHTSELQSRENLVCRLLLEKKKTN